MRAILLSAALMLMLWSAAASADVKVVPKTAEDLYAEQLRPSLPRQIPKFKAIGIPADPGRWWLSFRFDWEECQKFLLDKPDTLGNYLIQYLDCLSRVTNKWCPLGHVARDFPWKTLGGYYAPTYGPSLENDMCHPERVTW
jgi:hypothetical protein